VTHTRPPTAPSRVCLASVRSLGAGNPVAVQLTDAVGAPLSGAVSSFVVDDKKNIAPATAVDRTIAMRADQNR
jgi:hypothetical protein